MPTQHQEQGPTRPSLQQACPECRITELVPVSEEPSVVFIDETHVDVVQEHLLQTSHESLRNAHTSHWMQAAPDPSDAQERLVIPALLAVLPLWRIASDS